MPVYPGAEPPRITDACTIDGHGFAEKSIRFFRHTGTHVDAPAHLLAGAATLDRSRRAVSSAGMRFGRFRSSRPADRNRRPGKRSGTAGESGIRDSLQRLGEKLGRRLVFYRLSGAFGEAARWLAAFNLKGVGADMISFDEMNSAAMPVHKIFLGKNMVLVENLRGLEALTGLEFVFPACRFTSPGATARPSGPSPSFKSVAGIHIT